MRNVAEHGGRWNRESENTSKIKGIEKRGDEFSLSARVRPAFAISAREGMKESFAAGFSRRVAIRRDYRSLLRQRSTRFCGRYNDLEKAWMFFAPLRSGPGPGDGWPEFAAIAIFPPCFQEIPSNLKGSRAVRLGIGCARE